MSSIDKTALASSMSLVVSLILLWGAAASDDGVIELGGKDLDDLLAGALCSLPFTLGYLNTTACR
jgi:hypothetical protein